MDLDLNGIRFRTGKLSAFEQFHIMRRLAPLLSGLGQSFAQLPARAPEAAPTITEPGLVEPEAAGALTEVPENAVEDEAAIWQALGPVADALSKMSDEDTEYVIRSCLNKAQKHNGSNWARVMVGTRMMFEDEIDLGIMMQLTVETIRENLQSFFPGNRAQNSGAG